MNSRTVNESPLQFFGKTDSSESSAVPNRFSEYFKNNNRVDLLHHSPLPGPLSVFFEATNICNFKCKFCPESFENYKQDAGGLHKLSEQDFVRVADQIKAFGTVKLLNFYMMGEPFANKNFPSYLRYVVSNQVAGKVIVTSNGTLITPEKYEEICTSGLDFLRVSIYGATEESHRRVTQSSIQLSRIIENIRGLKEFRDRNSYNKPHIYIKMIESTDAEENSAFLRKFSGVGDELGLEGVKNWNDPGEGVLSNVSLDKLLTMEHYKNKKEVCPFPFYTLVIHSDLKVSVCCVDWNKKAVVGDLRKNSLQEIWNGSELHEFRLKHIQRRKNEIDGCRNCTYLHTLPDNLDTLDEATYLARLEESGKPTLA
jgi:radical SAM protein with 4Fe4S-binding SPASM domain